MKFSRRILSLLVTRSPLCPILLITGGFIGISAIAPVLTSIATEPAPLFAKSCKEYVAKATNTVQQAEAGVTGARSQLQEAEEKANVFQELAKAGAVSQKQVEQALKNVRTAKKDLERAIAKQNEAQQQLTMLQKLTSCEDVRVDV